MVANIIKLKILERGNEYMLSLMLSIGQNDEEKGHISR